MYTMALKGDGKSIMLSLTFMLVITLSTAAMNDYHHSEKMLLSDVKALTLRKGQMTNARRSRAVPQLKCVGGAAQDKFSPEVVQCINMGSNGYDIQWECKTDMDNAYRFGTVEVSCEGYDYPNDPYILKGSCGLEYTIEFTEEGLRRDQRKSGSSYHYTNNYNQQKESEGGISGLFVFAGVIFAIYVVYKTCLAPETQHHRGSGNQQQQPPPYGFRSEYTQPPTGPPPPYNSWNTPDSNCAGSDPFNSAGYSHQHSRSDYRNTRHSSDAGGGGFWSGAATGGLLGYMLGSRNTGGGHRTSPEYRSSSPHESTGFFSSSNHSSSSSGGGSSGTRTASGFGGTSRR